MCFSAPVSFAASIILLGIGSAAVKLVRENKAWPLLGLALTPLFFGIQQFMEGIIWITINNPPQHDTFLIAKNCYLFCATALWPGWFALMLYIAEKERKPRYILLFFSLLGLFFGYKSLTYIHLYNVNQYQFSLEYYPVYSNSPANGYGLFVYTAIGSIPFLFSSLRNSKVFLACMVIPLIIINIIDSNYTVSLWCFLCALASSFIYIIIKQNLPFYTNNQATEKTKI